MDKVQVEQKSYEMPPREGFTVAHFLTVADIERSARFLRNGLRRTHSEQGRWKRTRRTSESQTRGSSSTSAAARPPTSRR